MAVFYLSSKASLDLTGGADFSAQLVTAIETASSRTVSVANATTETSYAFSNLHRPANADWETGTITVKVNVTTAVASMFLSIQADRINSTGAVQESSAATAEQQLSSTGVFTFTVASTNWTAGSCDDRLRIRYIFRSAQAHGGALSVVIATGTANETITTDAITFNSGSCVGLFTTDSKQFETDHSTIITTGGATISGVTDNIYLDTRISSWDPGEVITSLNEARKVGTTFTDASTQTAQIALQYNPTPAPHIRRAHTTVYDSTLKRMLLFGGWDGTTRFNDVFELTLDSYDSPQPQWRKLVPTGTPPSARTTHNAFFDATNNRMIVGLGNDGSEKNDMYSLSFTGGRDGAWTTLSPTGGPPAVRGQASMCNDIANTRAYLVAGWGAAARFNDIWEFNYSTTNGVWTQKSADGDADAFSRRNDPACVWDATNSRIVAFGGFDATNWLNDTWQYVPGTDTWTNKTAVFSGTPPSVRELMFCALDTTNNRMVIFGGRNGTASANIRNDYGYLTLTAGSETWSVVTLPDAGYRPSGSWTNAGIYDPNHELFICFGGLDSTLEVHRHLLAIDCSSSSTLTMKAIVLNEYLRGRDAVAYAYNSDRDETLIAGGFARVDSISGSIFNGEHTNDLWIYRHATTDWVLALRTDVATEFTPREGSVAIYDSTGTRFIIFGGLAGNGATQLFFNDVFEVKIDANGVYRLTKLAPTGTPPSARWLAAAVFDSTNNRMIVFGGDAGGSYLNDVYELDFAGGSNGAWASISPSGTPPSGRRQTSYAYDSGENAMLISHGGLTVSTFASNSFKLALTNGAEAWTTLSTSGSPPSGRRGMIAVYHAVNDKFYFFGGYDGTNNLNDLFSLESDASPAWATLTPTGTVPSIRRSHGAGYSPTSGKMMVFGGRNDTFDTWDSRGDTNEYNVSGNSWANPDPKIYINGSVATTSLEKGWSYHWQTWTTGSLSGASAKTSYGGNAETATDFATLLGLSDSITLTESVTVSIVADTNLSISVFDTVTLTESVTLLLQSFINVFDTPTLTESVSVTNDTGYTNIFDSITLTENTSAELQSYINVFDSITLTESVSVTNDTGYTNIFDSITLTENTSAELQSDINVFDTVTITENINTEIPLIISVFDAITLTESTTVINDTGYANVFDGITLTESTTVTNDTGYTSIFDAVTLTENVIINAQNNINIFDSVTVAEDSVILLLSFINVFDTLTTTENLNELNVSNISVFDSTTITESVVITNETGYTNVFDLITLTENTSVEIPTSIDVFDTVTLTENVILLLQIFINVFDSITLTENINVDTHNNINIFDLISLTESVTIDAQYNLSVSDLTTLTENVNIEAQNNIIVFDVITLSENVVGVNEFGYTDISETLTISEVTSIIVFSGSDLEISTNDTITLTETVTSFGSLGDISPFESLSISESSNVDNLYNVPFDGTVGSATNMKLAPRIF